MKDIIKILRDSSDFSKRTGKYNLTAFGMTDLLDTAANRIADLEAQLEAIKNPPYRILTNVESLGDFVGNDCGWSVLRGNEFVMEQWGYDTEAEAQEAAEQFLARLTAPFKSKD